MYDAILCFLDESDDELNRLHIISNKISEYNFDIMYRIKSEESLRLKWGKNLGKSKQLRKVCNDIIGIRIITDISKDEISNIIMDLSKEGKYNIEIVNLYSKFKSMTMDTELFMLT
jgi:ppGpp synthetase/RelA/SpoT-type nucleotidyltranferase